MSDAQTIAVEVIGIEQVTPLIKHFKLAPVAGGTLPVFSGGSHIIVVMQGAERMHRNPYSLLGSPQQLDSYEIGVRRMEESRGGSHFMHDGIAVGSPLGPPAPNPERGPEPARPEYWLGAKEMPETGRGPCKKMPS